MYLYIESKSSIVILVLPPGRGGSSTYIGAPAMDQSYSHEWSLGAPACDKSITATHFLRFFNPRIVKHLPVDFGLLI